MRLIGELKDQQQAQTFAAYLLVKGIETQADSVEDQVEIWVKDEDRFEEAIEELKAFQANPTDNKYASAVTAAKAIIKEEEKKRLQFQKNLVKVSGGQLPRRRPLTIALIVASAIVALLTGFGEKVGGRGGPEIDHPVYRALQSVSLSPEARAQVLVKVEGNRDDLRVRFANVMRGEVWRLFTTIFIHYGIFHLIFNMIWLFQFGTIIEHRYGTLKFALIVLATAVISNAFQTGVPDAVGGSVPYDSVNGVMISLSGGMSGVIYGLFGFIWMKSIYDRKFGYRLTQQTVIILVGWLFFCMIPAEMRAGIGFGTNVGNWAHGIGLVVGMAIGYLTSNKVTTALSR